MLGSFLSEAITEPRPSVLSPFNECLILATICGRSLFHGQQHKIRCVYGDMAPDWVNQHRSLNNIVMARLQILSQYYPSPTDAYDPMLLFANIMGQATIIYLCQGLNRSVEWPIDHNRATFTFELQQRALMAASNMVDLARELTEFHIFKVIGKIKEEVTETRTAINEASDRSIP